MHGARRVDVGVHPWFHRLVCEHLSISHGAVHCKMSFLHARVEVARCRLPEQEVLGPISRARS